MQAIKTVYLGPTNTRGARIKASVESGHSVTIDYPYDTNQGIDAHSRAAIALCRQMGWSGDLVGGGLRDCYVFVFTYGDNHIPVILTEAQRDAARERHEARLATIDQRHR